jgi:hypothetical protein
LLLALGLAEVDAEDDALESLEPEESLELEESFEPEESFELEASFELVDSFALPSLPEDSLAALVEEPDELDDRESVMYQPLPLKTMPTG